MFTSTTTTTTTDDDRRATKDEGQTTTQMLGSGFVGLLHSQGSWDAQQSQKVKQSVQAPNSVMRAGGAHLHYRLKLN